MNDIGAAVIALLKSKTAITDIVGTSVFADHMPQAELSNGIVLFVISENPQMALDGATGLDQARIQLNAFSKTRAEANRIAWTIWTELNGFAGSVSNVQVKGVSRSSGVSYRTDRVQSGSDEYRFVATQDLLFSYCSLP